MKRVIPQYLFEALDIKSRHNLIVLLRRTKPYEGEIKLGVANLTFIEGRRNKEPVLLLLRGKRNSRYDIRSLLTPFTREGMIEAERWIKRANRESEKGE